MKDFLQKTISGIASELVGEEVVADITIPADLSHGDYTTNISFIIAKRLGKSPNEVAELIVEKAKEILKWESTAEIAGNGFINFSIDIDELVSRLFQVLASPQKIVGMGHLNPQKIMVEYAHPNTHKEAHIGHTRTLMTGESISRILEANGKTVFRANYQGDVGPHVAKAVYGVNSAIHEDGLTLEEMNKWDNFTKAHFLGQSYARGVKAYEDHKEEIDNINKLIYAKGEGNYELWHIYEVTRQWSLDYYDDLYKLFGVKFDRLFFETEMADDGPRIVKENIGNVFVQDSDGSIIFPGEKYGLHTRVFITKQGMPTYEGKEMANAFKEWETFHFDKKIHVVGSEQEGYFQVVFKALELIDPQKFFPGNQVHLPTGIIQLKDRKMSSRTGDVLTYNQLIDEVKNSLESLFTERKLTVDEKEQVKTQVALAAIKYSVLKVGTRQNASFDIKQSVSISGDSGPYLQYTYVRTQSILEKSGENMNEVKKSYMDLEDRRLERKVYQFPEVVTKAAETLSPSDICTYLFDLAQLFNNFYQKNRIIDNPNLEQRKGKLLLTAAVGVILRQGLGLLGIETPQKM